MRDGLCCVYAHGATAAIMIQENWDAPLKAGLVGPSETIPVIDGTLGLSTWQGVFFCEFDGPRSDRSVSVTVLGDG